MFFHYIQPSHCDLGLPEDLRFPDFSFVRNMLPQDGRHQVRPVQRQHQRPERNDQRHCKKKQTAGKLDYEI